MKSVAKSTLFTRLAIVISAFVFGLAGLPGHAQSADTNSPAEQLLQRGYDFEGRGDLTNAFLAYREAAEMGSTFAMAEVYLCYWDAKGATRNHVKAMAWLKKSADAGNPYGECLMGYRCENTPWEGEGQNWHHVKPDWTGALHWYRLSAAQNWPGGQYNLGRLYLQGKAVELDEARGLELVRSAADQQQWAAEHELASLYAQGIGEPRNEEDRPIPILQRIHAWEDLIFRFEHGLGTDRDLIVAAQYYCQQTLAQSNKMSLAAYLEFHPNPPPATFRNITPSDGHARIICGPRPANDQASDEVLRAVSLYLKSARGETPAALQIARRYQTGQDAPRSVSRAWAWFTIAGRNGSAEAQTIATKLESQMSRDELAAARKYLAEQTDILKLAASAIANR